MKYIKKFENIKNPKTFFKVILPISIEELTTIIWKLGEDAKTYETFISNMIKNVSNIKNKMFYLSRNDSETDARGRIGHMMGDDYGFNYYIRNKWEYLGVINATIEEIEQYKLEQDAKKYNL